MGGVKGLFLMLGSSERCGNLVWGSGLGDCVWRQWVGNFSAAHTLSYTAHNDTVTASTPIINSTYFKQ